HPYLLGVDVLIQQILAVLGVESAGRYVLSRLLRTLGRIHVIANDLSNLVWARLRGRASIRKSASNLYTLDPIPPITFVRIYLDKGPCRIGVAKRVVVDVSISVPTLRQQWHSTCVTWIGGRESG